MQNDAVGANGGLKRFDEVEKIGELGKKGKWRKDAARFVRETNVSMERTKSR